MDGTASAILLWALKNSPR